MNARADFAEREERRLGRLLATAIHAECTHAAGHGHGKGNVRDMEAIAAALLNRAALENRKGTSGVSFETLCQERIALVERPLESQTKDPLFVACHRIARRALAGVLPDPTQGATHFHTQETFPGWAHGRTPAAAFGNHLYYREET